MFKYNYYIDIKIIQCNAALMLYVTYIYIYIYAHNNTNKQKYDKKKEIYKYFRKIYEKCKKNYMKKTIKGKSVLVVNIN